MNLTARRRPRVALVGVAVAGVMIGVVATVAVQHATDHTSAHRAPAPATPSTNGPPVSAPRLTATVDLLGSTSTDANIGLTHDNRCFGLGPYGYLDADAPVIVTGGASGVVLASSKLSQGDLLDGECQFTFSVPTLPSMSTYRISIAAQPAVAVSQVRMQTGLILRGGRGPDDLLATNGAVA